MGNRGPSRWGHRHDNRIHPARDPRLSTRITQLAVPLLRW